MTPIEFYQQLAQVKRPGVIDLPVPIQLGKDDVMAARMLLWLFEEMDDDATHEDRDNVLDAAKWWVIFWDSAHLAEMKRLSQE